MRSYFTWLPLILCMIVALALPLMRGDVPGDRAYAAFQAARDLTGLPGSSGFSPLFVLPLALAARLSLPVAQIGMVLSVTGWLATLVAVYWMGMRLNHPVMAVSAVVALTIEPTLHRLLGQDALWVMGWLWVALANLQSQISDLKGWMAGLMLIVLAAAALAQIQIAPALMLASYGPALIAGLILLGGWGLDRVIAFITRWPAISADKDMLAASLAVIALAGWGYARGSIHLLERAPSAEQRLALLQRAGVWLKQNTPPDATAWTDAPHIGGALSYFAERPIIRSATFEAERPPDYAVAVNSLAWAQRLNQPWFQEHYRRVFALANPYDSLAPLELYRYRPGPYDFGAEVSIQALLGESLELLSYRLDSHQLIPGEDQYLTLTWRAWQPFERLWNVRVRVIDPMTQRVVAQADSAAPGGLKTVRWPVNRPLADRYRLPIPYDLSPGVYQLDVRVYGDDVQQVLAARDQAQLTLAQLEVQPWVSAIPMQAARPLTATFGDPASSAIELIGYGLRPASDVLPIVERGGALRLRLTWHARAAPSESYHVFTHVLTADNRLVAQSDSVPVYETFPTDQWQAGQYILDEHIIPIGSDVPPGRYWLKIGLYSSDSGERVMARDAAGREAPEHSLPLVPVEVE